MSRIEGTVLSAAGKPVAHARVFFSAAPGAVSDVALLSGADGRFVLSAPHAGRYEISASHDTLGSGRAEVVVGADGAAPRALQIKLSR